MSVDKLVDSAQLDSDLTSVANAIRTRGGTSADLAFPSGFVSAVGAIGNQYTNADEGKVVSNGALVAQGSDTVTQNGTVDTTLINSLTVNVSGGGGGVATGTVTPAARTLTMSFDAGLSTITGLLIVPESETPLKSGGKTCVGIVYTPNCYYQKIGLTTNNSGASALAPTTNGSAISVSVSGTNVTVQVASNTPGYFEAITYRWYAW